MMHTNVNLSEKEMELVTNADFILTKNRIIDKVYEIFGDLSTAYLDTIERRGFLLPKEVVSISAKIYKGERYLELPYAMMDYPRYFTKQDSFAVRSFFWWGNFFSISLHLRGKYLRRYEKQILQHSGNVKFENWFLYTGYDEWDNRFNEDNFVPLFNYREHVDVSRDFLKISKKMSLENWSYAFNFFATAFDETLQLLTP